MKTPNLERAFSTARGVIANVTPDHYGDPTPCASWDIRALLNHMVGGSHNWAVTVTTGESPTPAERDWTEGDLLANYDEGITATLAAFAGDGVDDKALKLPFGAIPAPLYLGIVTSDSFVHAWDLANATGQSTDLDAELATQLLAVVRGFVQDPFRGPDGSGLPFGPEVSAPEGATPADQLAAFLGRSLV